MYVDGIELWVPMLDQRSRTMRWKVRRRVRTAKSTCGSLKPCASGRGGGFHGSPQDPIDDLRAIDDQIAARLGFRISLVIDDVNVEAYTRYLTKYDSPAEVELMEFFGSLGFRIKDGVRRPASEVWDGFRGNE